MMGKEYVIAYDLGTSGVKAALVDLEGNFMADAAETYPLYTPHPGWAEQDPQLYWEGVSKATKKVLKKSGAEPGKARGMAFGTQWKGIIPIDAGGKVLHHSIIWLDNRAADQAERLNRYFGKNLFCGEDYWPKLMWFREKCPELYERSQLILEANSFLKWKATGVAAVDLTNHFVRSFDGEIQEFYNRYLEAAGLSPDKFPPLVRASDRVGELTKKAADEMGLCPGIPVFGGFSDIPAITVGAGSTKPGSMHAYFGSSGWLGLTREHSSKDLYLSPFDETRDVFLYAMQAVGLSLNWTAGQLYHREGEELGDGIYDRINQEVADIPPGSGGVLATPWVYGERPPHFSGLAKGTFLNLNSCHDRRHMVKAVMEGVCFTLKMNVSDHWEGGGERPACVNAVGGGSLSDVWMQALADILELPVHVPENPRHAGAVGTAYVSLTGLGLCGDFEEAAKQIRIGRSFEPRPGAVRIYREAYENFYGLYRLLKPVFEKSGQQNQHIKKE